MTPEYRRFADKAAVASAVAGRVREVVADAARGGNACHVVLTGGSMGEAVMAALTADGGTALDWSGIHLWWGDERFLSTAHPDRNDTQADGAGLRSLERFGLDPARVHRLPGPDAQATGDDLAAAASSYANELRRAAGDGQLPGFDVVMLGVGPDGHVASLFPGHPSTVNAASASATVIPVVGSPKPPSRRLSMSLPALCSAREVWLMVAGSDKADAVERARSCDDPHVCPAGAVHGRELTTWWLDDAAAGASPRAG